MDKKKIYSLDDALRLSEKEIKEMYRDFINPGLVSMMSMIGFDKIYASASGAIVKDNEGREYIDFLGGYGALNLGHNHPKVIEVQNRVKNLPNILQASLGSLSAVLAANLANITPGRLKRCFFCNSGAEAVEGALKMARIASGKEKIIFCEGSFHGKTFGALSVTGREKYRKYFKPLLPGCESVPFGDIIALEKKLRTKEAAAFILECIQGEGGIIVPPDGYLSTVRDLCTQYNTLLIVDEIQTGLGRTGKMFACEHENIEPDIMCLAKSLGGGVAPLGAFITSEEIHNKAYGGMEKALLHTSTFGGNSFAAATGIRALNLIKEEKLAEQAKEKGTYLMERLKKLQAEFSVVKDVRGKGLMVGLELFGSSNSIINILSGGTIKKLSEEYYASMVAGKLLSDYRIITAYTLNNPNVIRIEPPLNISYDHLDYLLMALENIFSENTGFLNMAVKTIKKAYF